MLVGGGEKFSSPRCVEKCSQLLIDRRGENKGQLMPTNKLPPMSEGSGKSTSLNRRNDRNLDDDSTRPDMGRVKEEETQQHKRAESNAYSAPSLE